MAKGGGQSEAGLVLKAMLLMVATIVVLIILIIILIIALIFMILNILSFCIPLFNNECAAPAIGYYKEPVENEHLYDLSLSMIQMREDYESSTNYMHYTPKYMGYVGQYKEDHIPGIFLASAERVVGEEEEEEENKDDGTTYTIYEEDSYVITDITAYDRNKVESRLKINVAPDSKSGLTNYFREPKNRNVFQWIVDAAMSEEFGNGIDPIFLVAITIHETGNGRSSLLWNSNNPGGIRNVSPETKQLFKSRFGIEIKDGENFAVFNSLEEGFKYKAWLIRNYYADMGYLSIPEFQSKYAPTDDPLDTQGLNNHWIKNVAFLMNEFGVKNLGDLNVAPVSNGAPRPNFEQYEMNKTIIYNGSLMNMLDFLKHFGTQEMDLLTKGAYYEYLLEEKNLEIDFTKINTFNDLFAEILGTSNVNYNDLFKKFVRLSPEEEEEALEILGINKVTYDQAIELRFMFGTDYSDEEKSRFHLEVPIFYTETKVPESEIHLRTLMDFDMRGFDGAQDWIDYETAVALNNIYLMLGKKYHENNRFIVDTKSGTFDEEAYEKDREMFYDVLKDTGVFDYDEYIGRDYDLVVEEILMTPSSNREAVYRLASDHGIVFPFIVRAVGYIPSGYDEKLEKEIIDAREEYVEELDEKLLTAVSVGHFFKKYSIELFYEYLESELDNPILDLRDNLFMGSYIDEFRTRVRGEYEKVLRERETGDFREEASCGEQAQEESGVWNMFTKWASCTGKAVWNNATGAVKFTFDEIFTVSERKKAKYIDKAIAESEFIRFAMYRDTHEMAEIGAYVKNMCFYGLYYDAHLRTDYLAKARNGDFDYEANANKFANFDSEICRYMNAFSIEGNHLSWQNSDVLDKSTADANFDYVRVSLIPAEEAKLSQMEYEYSQIEGIMTDDEYNSLINETERMRGDVEHKADLIEKTKDLVRRKVVSESVGNQAIQNLENEIANTEKRIQESEEQIAQATEVREQAAALKQAIEEQKKKIEAMKARERELQAIRAQALQSAINDAQTIGTKCFEGGCAIPDEGLLFEGAEEVASSLSRIFDMLSPPRIVDIYEEWHTGVSGVFFLDLIKNIREDKPDDNLMKDMYIKVTSKYYEAILQYDKYLTGAERARVMQLANKISRVNQEFQHPFRGENFRDANYAKALLIYMPEDFKVAILNGEKVAVGLIERPSTTDIIKGKFDLKVVDVANNTEIILTLNEPLVANSEEPIVERIETTYHYMFSPYYTDVFEAYMQSLDNSLRVLNYKKDSKEKENFDLKTEYLEDSLEKFELLTGVDLAKDTNFRKAFRKWMSTISPPRGSDNFSVIGGGSSNGDGQNPIYDPDYYAGMNFGLPVETNGGKMRITSVRGQRWGTLHAGMDVGRHEWRETNILAVADGVVHQVQRITHGYGYNVTLKHEGPKGVFYTRYAHLKPGSIVVQTGQTVAKGQKLAVMGTSGNSTGIHLHFNVYQGNMGEQNTVDPIPALGYDGSVAMCSDDKDKCLSRYGWN